MSKKREREPAAKDEAANKKQKGSKHQYRFAITFGEVAILHIGGTEVGSGIRDSGFSVPELKEIATKIGDQAELIQVSDALPESLRSENEAATLVIRNGVSLLGVSADDLFSEQLGLKYDDKYFDRRRGKTLNKQARLNVVFGEEARTASEDFREFTIHSFPSLPHLNQIRQKLPSLLGARAESLNAEGNKYHHAKSGIGFHGDSERKIVVCVSLGTSSMLRYCWRMPGSSKHTGSPVDLTVNHGDIYIMSEKATGWDWRHRSKVRVVHAAGAAKYTTAK
eukprot:c7717_g1_i2.p1 GENE.c7717_g1_i2~~c7717_g1_i2.p1  ORF type:complete len:300 (+),score=67.00 c7717_g1_i2:62-901(+)